MSDDVGIVVPEFGGLVVAEQDDSSARAVKQYVVEQLSPRSRQTALAALRRIARLVFGPEAPAEVFPWHKLNYELAKRLRRALYDQTVAGQITPGTANVTLSHLRGIVRTMYGMGIVTHEQLSIAHPKMIKNVPGSRTVRGRSLSAAEEGALRAAARSLVGGYRGAMLDTAIVLAVGGGLRREEVTVVDLDQMEPGSFSIVGKGNKVRKTIIDTQMRRAIDDWSGERERIAPDHRKLFCSPQRPDWELSPWSFWSLVREAAHEAFGKKKCEPGCKCLDVITGPHDFRRTFATRLLDQGMDIRQVQVLMGHESPETTARYDKRDLETLFEKRRNMRIVA